jgi:hypothetical protein
VRSATSSDHQNHHDKHNGCDEPRIDNSICGHANERALHVPAASLVLSCGENQIDETVVVQDFRSMATCVTHTVVKKRITLEAWNRILNAIRENRHATAHTNSRDGSQWVRHLKNS